MATATAGRFSMSSITTDLDNVNALLRCRAVTVAERGTLERIPSSPMISPGRTLEKTNSSPSHVVVVKPSRFRRGWPNFESYNNVRSHRAIGRRTPPEALEARPKARPFKPGVLVEGYRIRYYKVDATGKVSLRYRGLLFNLGIGRAYRGRRVVMMLAGPQVRVLNEEYQLIRELTIDPTKKYQDQG